VAGNYFNISLLGKHLYGCGEDGEIWIGELKLSRRKIRNK
jgi:hypothetical protein